MFDVVREQGVPRDERGPVRSRLRGARRHQRQEGEYQGEERRAGEPGVLEQM